MIYVGSQDEQLNTGFINKDWRVNTGRFLMFFFGIKFV